MEYYFPMPLYRSIHSKALKQPHKCYLIEELLVEGWQCLKHCCRYKDRTPQRSKLISPEHDIWSLLCDMLDLWSICSLRHLFSWNVEYSSATAVWFKNWEPNQWTGEPNHFEPNIRTSSGWFRLGSVHSSEILCIFWTGSKLVQPDPYILLG